VIRARAAVEIVGEPIEYPSPQRLIDAVVAHPEFRAWLDARYPSTRWQLRFGGIHAPRGHSFAGLGYGGGPAPVESIRLYVMARGTSPGSEAYVTIDPWTASVEDVAFR